MKKLAKKLLLVFVFTLAITCFVACGEPPCEHVYLDEYTCHDRECTACGEVLVATTSHNEVIDNAKPATCTESGLTEGKHCSVCNDVLVAQEVVPAGHQYNREVTAPTCTEQGYTTHTCSCGDTYIDEYVNANGHNEVIDNAKPATCTESGLTEGKHCSVCDDVLVAQEVVPAGHQYNREVTAPTCTEQGYTIYRCVCGDAYISDYVNESGHKISYVPKGQGNHSKVCSNKGCNYTVEESCKYEQYIENPTGPNQIRCVCGNATVVEDNGVFEMSNNVVAGLTDYGKTLKEIVIPNGITTIAKSAFEYATFESITIPNTVTSIGERAFEYCEKLKSITFEKEIQLEVLEYGTFRYCSSLTDIAIPDSVKVIQSLAFENCTSLKNVTFGPLSLLNTIESWAFYGCNYLESISIPNGVTSIGECSFSFCWALKTVKFGENSQLKSIGDYAFENCHMLTSIIIPDSVTSMGYGVFLGSESRKTIYCEAESEPSDWDNDWDMVWDPLVYWYSETEPTETGNYWRYVDGEPTAW